MAERPPENTPERLALYAEYRELRNWADRGGDLAPADRERLADLESRLGLAGRPPGAGAPSPRLEAAREALRALPDDAARALDPEPGPAAADLPAGAPPPPPFVLPEHLAGKPDAALRAAQDAALAAGLTPERANAAGRAAAEYVLAHGTSPETVHKRELLRGTEAGLPPGEVVRLAREAGDRAAAAREAARAPQPPGPAPPAIPLPDPAPPSATPLPEPPPAGPERPSPFTLPLPEPPAAGVAAPQVPGATLASPVSPPGPLPAPPAGPQPAPFTLPLPPVLGPADVVAPGAPPVPPPDAVDPESGGGTPPWWDPALGAVVGAGPGEPTLPWWDPLLGQVVEPGAATARPESPAGESVGPPRQPPWDVTAGLAEAEEEARAEEPPRPADAPRGETRRAGRDSPFGGDPFGYAGRVLGRGLDELLGPGGDYGPEGGGGEGAGGAGMMEVLVRIAEGVERLIEVVGESRAGGGGPLGPGSVEGTRDFGYDDDAETPASPSVDLWDLFRPGKASDAAGHPRAEAPKRQRQGEQE